jgi:hypothetical protein
MDELMSDVEQRQVMLRAMKDRVGSGALEELTGLDQWGVFGLAMDLLIAGKPVCIRHAEGTWLNFTQSTQEVSYRLARKPRELAQMRDMLDTQLSYLCRIRSGIEVAQERMAIPCDAPTTEDLTAGP